jgi:hypothetical protein
MSTFSIDAKDEEPGHDHTYKCSDCGIEGTVRHYGDEKALRDSMKETDIIHKRDYCPGKPDKEKE